MKTNQEITEINKNRKENNRINRNKINILFELYMDTHPGTYVNAGEDGVIDIKGKFGKGSIMILSEILREYRFDNSSDLEIRT